MSSIEHGRISKSLYELSDELERLISEHTDEDGVLDESVEVALLQLAGDWEEKCVQVALYIKGLRCEADATRAVAQQIELRAKQDRARADVLFRQADRIERYLDGQMQGRQVRSIKDPRASISYRRSPGQLVIDRPELVTADMHEDPKPTQPSAKKIKDLLKAEESDLLVRYVEDAEGEKQAVTVAHIERPDFIKIS